jgi:hypothetical protein
MLAEGNVNATGMTTDNTNVSDGAVTEDAVTESDTQQEASEPQETEQEQPQGAPEQYTDFTLPEGFVLEGESKTLIADLGKELNLTQDQAQTVIDRYIKASELSADVQADASNKAWEKKIADDELALKKEWGVDYDKNTAIIDKAKREFIGADDMKYFEDNGFTKVNEFKRLLHKIGEKISEDNKEDGTPPNSVREYSSFADMLPQPTLERLQKQHKTN